MACETLKKFFAESLVADEEGHSLADDSDNGMSPAPEVEEEEPFQVEKMSTLDQELMDQLCKKETAFQDAKVTKTNLETSLSQGDALSKSKIAEAESVASQEREAGLRLTRHRESLEAFGQSLDAKRGKQADKEAEHNAAIGRLSEECARSRPFPAARPK